MLMAPIRDAWGIAVVHNFPVNGEYVFEVSFYTYQQGYLFGQNQGKGQQIEVAVNGARVALFDIDPKWKVGQDLKTPPVGADDFTLGSRYAGWFIDVQPHYQSPGAVCFLL